MPYSPTKARTDQHTEAFVTLKIAVVYDRDDAGDIEVTDWFFPDGEHQGRDDALEMLGEEVVEHIESVAHEAAIDDAFDTE